MPCIRTPSTLLTTQRRSPSSSLPAANRKRDSDSPVLLQSNANSAQVLECGSGWFFQLHPTIGIAITNNECAARLVVLLRTYTTFYYASPCGFQGLVEHLVVN